MTDKQGSPFVAAIWHVDGGQDVWLAYDQQYSLDEESLQMYTFSV